jgi:hypothetical protein
MLQYNNDEIRVFVDAKQIDTPPRSLPVSELLRDKKRSRSNHLNVFTQKPLQVPTFL